MTQRALPARLDAVDAAQTRWAHQTGTFVALGWRFVVRTTEPALGRLIDHQLSGLRDDTATADHVYSILSSGGPTPLRALYVDGERVRYTADPGLLLERLVWHVNQSVIRRPMDGRLLLHAAAVERGGRAALLVAPMEAGKTTLAAGLVQRGCGYLSDEVAALDTATGDVLAYPKPLSVDRGSWHVLAELEPSTPSDVADFGNRQWLVPPDALRPGATTRRARPTLVVLPQYAARKGTRLQPVTRAEALVDCWSQVFGANDCCVAAFRALAALLRRCRVVRLQHDDLDAACSLVLDELART